MGKSEVGNELHSLNQVTIALLLLAMVLMRDTMDSEVILAICLACILSLVITEVELSQDPVSDINRNSAEGDPGQEQFTTAGTPSPNGRRFPVDDDPVIMLTRNPEPMSRMNQTPTNPPSLHTGVP